jgi:Fe-S-cluster containining protein
MEERMGNRDENGLLQGLESEAGRDASAVDAAIAGWTAAYSTAGGKIFCGKGCSGCCSLAVNCTLPEALRVAELLTEGQKRSVLEHGEKIVERLPDVRDLKEYLRMHRDELGRCPLLESDGSCGVYAVRPLSCRSLISTKESRWCSTDFAALDAAEKRTFVESLDTSAVAFPTHYAAFPQQAALAREEAAERLMKETFGFSLSGNLRYLLFVEVAHGIGRTVSRGFDATATFLFSKGLLLPFVLDLK